jgi:hypothetical protein
MKFMYVKGRKIHEIEAADKKAASEATRGSRLGFVFTNEMKAWLPENERCEFYPSGGWHVPCLNKRKQGELCGVHAATVRRDDERKAKYAAGRKQDAQLAVLRDRIEAATGIQASVGWGGLSFQPANAELLVEWVEAHSDKEVGPGTPTQLEVAESPVAADSPYARHASKEAQVLDALGESFTSFVAARAGGASGWSAHPVLVPEAQR